MNEWNKVLVRSWSLNLFFFKYWESQKQVCPVKFGKLPNKSNNNLWTRNDIRWQFAVARTGKQKSSIQVMFAVC